jgi:3'-5' exoribonuclease
MLNQSELRELKKGDPVDHFLLIKRSEIRNTRTGKEYLSIELGDKSTSLNANVWENFEDIGKVKIGEIASVKGIIEEFQNAPQIKISNIKLAKPSDGVNTQDFLPKSLRNLDEMKDEFKSRIEKISNTSLNSLLNQIFSGERLDKFTTAPAGKSWHHGYIHGLLEHTLEIIKICDLMCDFHSELNRDLLISGAMLHDFCKIDELSYDSAFEYTDEGKLLGHIVMAAISVNEEAAKIENFPIELRNNLIHLILSHQGKLEHATPVVPKTVEAIALYHADELSAKVNAYKNVISTDTKSDGNWTKYISLAQTDLYKSGINNNQEINSNKTLFD